MYFKYKHADRLNINGWENICHKHVKYDKAVVVILMWHNVEFQSDIITRNSDASL